MRATMNLSLNLTNDKQKFPRIAIVRRIVITFARFIVTQAAAAKEK
jgi:hypothetical protein